MGIKILIINIGRSDIRIRFIMGISMPMKRCLLSESVPDKLLLVSTPHRTSVMHSLYSIQKMCLKILLNTSRCPFLHIGDQGLGQWDETLRNVISRFLKPCSAISGERVMLDINQMLTSTTHIIFAVVWKVRTPRNSLNNKRPKIVAHRSIL